MAECRPRPFIVSTLTPPLAIRRHLSPRSGLLRTHTHLSVSPRLHDGARNPRPDAKRTNGGKTGGRPEGPPIPKQRANHLPTAAPLTPPPYASRYRDGRERPHRRPNTPCRRPRTPARMVRKTLPPPRTPPVGHDEKKGRPCIYFNRPDGTPRRIRRDAAGPGRRHSASPPGVRPCVRTPARLRPSGRSHPAGPRPSRTASPSARTACRSER